MAEDESENADAGAEGSAGHGEEGKKKSMMLPIIIGVVVLLLGAGAGLYFTGMLDSFLGTKPECVEVKDEHGKVTEPCPKEEEEAKHGEAAKEGEKPAEHAKSGESKGGEHGKGGEGEGENGNFVAIPPLLVNLNTDDGESRFLRLTVQIELEDPADRAAVEAIMPRVIDQFQTYLRELKIKDLRGSAGIYRLQMELLWRVNQASAPVKVKDVLFQEILIQ